MSDIFPEHQGVMIQSSEEFGGERIYYTARCGVSEGVQRYNAHFGINSTSNTPRTEAAPGLLASFYEDVDGKPKAITIADYTTNPDDIALERRAMYIMEGTSPIEIAEYNLDQLRRYDPITDQELCQRVYTKFKYDNFHTTDKTNMYTDPFAFADTVEALTSGPFRKDWNYNIFNRNCKHFARALKDKLVFDKDSEFLPTTWDRPLTPDSLPFTVEDLVITMRKVYSNIIESVKPQRSSYITPVKFI
jgi:hypothetical protein